MAIDPTLFSIDTSGNLRQISAFVPGTNNRYSTLDLHVWLQSLATALSVVGDDNVYIAGPNPSSIAGLRNTTRPTPLTLLNGINIDDATSQWFNYGSISQPLGNYLYTGVRVLGTNVANSPIYIVQNAAKITKYWADSDISNFRILVKAMTGGSLIDSGNLTVYSRKYGQLFSHFDVNLAAGSEQVAAISTSLDSNTVITSTSASTIFSTITVAVGDVYYDIGDGFSRLYKGTITLNGTTTVQQAYQALMWACSESSTATINSLAGWQYRKLNSAYPENTQAPMGSFAGGKWFVAQGWKLAGVMGADSQNYQLTSDDGTNVVSPVMYSLTLNGLQSGSVVKIFKTSDMSVLASTTSSTTSFSYSYTYSVDIPITAAIASLGYQDIYLTTLVLSNANQAIPISQVIDRQFNNP